MYRLALFTTLVSFLLILAGGLVTSTDSGLSVPDWPLSYGKLFPPMVGGILYEHTHRMIGASVGLLTLILTLWILFKENRRWVRRLCLFAFGLIALQGILGGLTVLWMLPAYLSIAHACLGPTFFATMVVLTSALSPQFKGGRLDILAPLPLLPAIRWSLATSGILYLQLILGAMIRHIGWSLPFLVAHGIGALVTFWVLFKTAKILLREYRSEPFFLRPTHWLTWLFTAQLILGIATLLRGAPTLLATAHVGVGALLLGLSFELSARCVRFLTPALSLRQLNRQGLSTYLELTKPRLTLLAVATSLFGYFLAGGLSAPASTWSTFIGSAGKLLILLVGTALVGGGAGALNQVLEWQEDAKMERTRRRPIPSGRIGVNPALNFGVCLSIAGLGLLFFFANPLSASWGAFTLAVYLFLYTPLKRRTPLCTLIGAIPGAMPPVIGWAAAQGTLGIGALVLFTLLFLWQLPHFLSIALSYREDFCKTNFKFLPVVDREGYSTSRQIALYLLALVPVSLLPAALGISGSIYFFGALFGSLGFLAVGLHSAWVPNPSKARRLFFASLIYLPWLLSLMTLDRVILS